MGRKGKLYCDDATYERLKLNRYRHDKILEDIERLDIGIKEAIERKDREAEALLKEERIAAMKSKKGLNEWIKILESRCYIKED